MEMAALLCGEICDGSIYLHAEPHIEKSVTPLKNGEKLKSPDWLVAGRTDLTCRKRVVDWPNQSVISREHSQRIKQVGSAIM